MELFQFGLAWAGFIVATAGVMAPSAGVTVLGGLLLAAGFAYFLLHN
jgi:hypothetical protein